ncbi:uncharacterized protein LOC126899610 [Daktulosphaira vitifoliae]|uniref:uncharacterized protein LOC126899610 n=1 Tax=Daktulosphaira vitifoliae TaxID=58002 RepID=UPI0021A9D1AF|nr:uncharacterized protein LOC126899610 [Daktulosphaira vitifoliae]
MPKNLLSGFLKEFGENIFSSDGKILFCKFCEVKVSATKRFLVTQHLKTAKHEHAVNQRKRRKQSTSQSLLTENTNKKSDFNSDLADALLPANIPLYKVNNLKFKKFLEKYTFKNIPNESTLRKNYVDSIYKNTLSKIQAEVFNRKIWVSIDETTDVDGRYVANVIVGVLHFEEPGKVMLVNCEHLQKTNSTTIAHLFDRTMNLIWPQGVEHNNVLLLVSDAAPYMVKAGSAIQIFFPKMLHVTCLAHALHRVAEQIRSDFPLVDKLISSVKKVFLKCPARIQIFKDEAPELSLPPQPVITRWGTWLTAAIYYCDSYETIKKIIDKFDPNDALSIKTAQEVMSERRVEANLAFIKSNFSFLFSALTSLEEKGKTLSKSVAIINTVSEKLEVAASASQGKTIYTKFQNVLEKNSGYKVLSKISKILDGETESLEGLPEVIETNDIVNFKHAPINSVDVERSFSTYKNILSDRRRSFKFENISKIIVIQCNPDI